MIRNLSKNKEAIRTICAIIMVVNSFIGLGLQATILIHILEQMK